MRTELLPVRRKARLQGSTVEVLAQDGHVVWMFPALELAEKYFSMSPEEFYARYMFLWIPEEPFASLALKKLGGCKV